MAKKKDAVLENEAAGDAAENRSDAPDEEETDEVAIAPAETKAPEAETKPAAEETIEAPAAPDAAEGETVSVWRGSHWANVPKGHPETTGSGADDSAPAK